MTEAPESHNILFLGAGGCLGGFLRKLAVSAPAGAGRAVFVSRRDGCDLRWAPGDSYDALPRAGSVVALWGVKSGDATALAQNAELAWAAREVAQATGASRVLHISSAAVYGPGEALSETDPLRPANPYGQAKCDMEREVAKMARQDARKIAHCCLRLCNVVGADSLAQSLLRPDPLTLDRFGAEGGPVRSYISPVDLFAVLLRLSELPVAALPETLNVAAPQPVTMDGLAAAAGAEVHWRAAPDQAIRTVTLSVARLTALLPDLDFSNTPAEMIADAKRAGFMS